MNGEIVYPVSWRASLAITVLWWFAWIGSIVTVAGLILLAFVYA